MVRELRSYKLHRVAKIKTKTKTKKNQRHQKTVWRVLKKLIIELS